MDASKLRRGMLVEYHHEPVEVMTINPESGMVEIRKCANNARLHARFEELTQDPQLHNDCDSYY